MLGYSLDIWHGEIDISMQVVRDSAGHMEVASVIGYWEEKPEMEEPEKERREAILGYCADDFGPQRFCKLCKNQLTALWDDLTDEFHWYHEESESGEEYCGFSEDYMLTDDMWAGIAGREPLTLENLKEVCKKKAGSWIDRHIEEVLTIYRDHGDDVGKEAELKEMPVVTFKDGKTLIKESSTDSYWKSPVTYENTLKLNKAERFLENHISHQLIKSHKGCREALDIAKKKGLVRPAIYNYLDSLVRWAKWRNLWHPRAERRYNKGYITWKAICELVQRDEWLEEQEEMGAF